MNVKKISEYLYKNSGQHILNIYMPSIGRDVSFSQLTVGDVKTIARISMFDQFNINNQFIKLALFDKLILQSKQSCGISSENISQIDYFSFLLGIRQLINNQLSFSFNCLKCKNDFSQVLNLQQKFFEMVHNFNRKKLIFEKTDNLNNKWKFILNSYTMRSYLNFKYFCEKYKEIQQDFSQKSYIKCLLYITDIYKNDQRIDDWDQQTFIDKFQFLNSLPNQLIFNYRDNEQNNDFLINFIEENFDQEKFIEYVNQLSVQCPYCGFKYDHYLQSQNLYFVLGYAEDNQQMYKNILQTQTYLIYYKWLTLDQINNMSYLDFTIYSERIFKMYEQQMKQKQEQMKNAANQVQEIQITSD